MNIGFSAPTRGEQATPEALTSLVQHGEALGFGIVTVSDHVVMPRDASSPYPYTPDGSIRFNAEVMEMLTVHAFLAASTTSLRLLTSVMVVPHRPPVLTAKVLATIDILSGGRLIVGCGAGWLREEFEAIGAPDFDRRGAVTAEYIRAFKELWTSESPTFDGEFCRFNNLYFEPKPVQKPHPPIWMGGESPAALRRAGRLADKWYPIGNNPTYPMGTLAELKAGFARVQENAAEAGRDPADVGLAYNSPWLDTSEAATLTDGSRRCFTGSPEQVAEDIREFEAASVTDLVLRFPGTTHEETLASLDRFAEEVMGKL